jgi:hypothetical protein
MQLAIVAFQPSRFAIDRNIQTPFAAGAMVHVSFPDHGVSFVRGAARDQVSQSVTPDPIRGPA